MSTRARKSIELDLDDVEWFERVYPHGNYSWLFTMLLKEFRKQHKETPQDYAALGALELKKLMEGESSSGNHPAS